MHTEVPRMCCQTFEENRGEVVLAGPSAGVESSKWLLSSTVTMLSCQAQHR